MSPSLSSWCRGFGRTREAWPPLPLANAQKLDWWRQLIGNTSKGALVGNPLVRALESAMPQLRLPEVK